MTQNANVTVVREFFEAFYAEDPAALEAVLDGGFLAHGPGGRTVTGADWRAMARMIRGAVPDVRTEIEAVVAEGELVAVRYTTAGTQKGELFGAPATDGAVTMAGIEIYRVADGRVAECWGQYDMTSVLGTAC